MPRTEDFVLAEAIRLDPEVIKSVGWGNLLEQANHALKVGSILIIKTAHKENKPTTFLFIK